MAEKKAPKNQGRETKGSRHHLQNFVNETPDLLNSLIVSASPSLLAANVSIIQWKSPLKGSTPDRPYFEYRDDFLQPLGLPEHEKALREFWPKNGPQWDALATMKVTGKKGCLLVEAKAYPDESKTATKASSAASILAIEKSLSITQGHMGVSPSDWKTGHYQLGNRLAFLYFMNEVIHVPTWLVLINFVNDTTHHPTDLSTWIETYREVFTSMGIKPDSPLMSRIIILFPPV